MRRSREAKRPFPAEKIPFSSSENRFAAINSARHIGTGIDVGVHSSQIYGGEKEEFKAGDTVLHKTFGEGMVLSAVKMGNDTLMEIAFEKVGTKKIFANFAKLTKK